MLGLIVGVIAGAAVGLLWSPRSGAENREKLAEALPGASEAAARASTDLKVRLGAAMEAFRAGAAETRERMRRELEQSRGGAAR
jgi:gas vesicle protein